jgi:Holliday junction resolvase RusA-like endonuclease
MRVFPGGGMVHSNKRQLMGFRSDVATEWGKAPMREGHVTITCVFAFARPESHYLPANSKRPTKAIRIDAPTAHIKAPDIDKLCRAVLDALTGRAYKDDAQVIALTAMKVWSYDGSTTIEILP